MLLKQAGCQVNIVCGNLLNAEGRQNGLLAQEAEQPVGGLVIQFLSRIGVNDAHHEQDVALPRRIKRCTLRENPANELMRDFAAALLLGALRITVENSASYLARFGTLNRYISHSLINRYEVFLALRKAAFWKIVHYSTLNLQPNFI